MINLTFMRNAFFNRSKKPALELDISGTAAKGTEAAAQKGQVIPLERRKTRQRRARDMQQPTPDERAREPVPIHVWTHEQPPVTYKNKPRAPEARMLDPIAESRKRMKDTVLQKPLFGAAQQQPLSSQQQHKALAGPPKPKPISDARQRKRTTVVPIKPEREPAILWDQ